jgi:hypothetical protein
MTPSIFDLFGNPCAAAPPPSTVVCGNGLRPAAPSFSGAGYERAGMRLPQFLRRTAAELAVLAARRGLGFAARSSASGAQPRGHPAPRAKDAFEEGRDVEAGVKLRPMQPESGRRDLNRRELLGARVFEALRIARREAYVDRGVSASRRSGLIAGRSGRRPRGGLWRASVYLRPSRPRIHHGLPCISSHLLHKLASSAATAASMRRSSLDLNP